MRSVTIILSVSILIMGLVSEISPAQENQTAQYSESAIRRFEIVTLISLPFTSVYSYLIVRLVKMARQGEVSPELSNGEWRAVQAGAVAMALLVGTWDWLHTRSVDRNEPRIPKLKPPEGEEEGENAVRVSALRIKF